jgi:cell division protein FtsN
MKGKIILLTVLAGGLFTAGLAVPDSWRSTVQDKIASLTAKQSSVKSPTVKTPSQEKPPGPGKKTSVPPVPFASIQQPLALGKGQKLGLGLGLFTTEEGAKTQIEQVAVLGYVVQVVAVKDKSGDVWYLPVAGKFGEENEALRVQAILAKALALEQGPDIVLVPPAPKK